EQIASARHAWVKADFASCVANLELETAHAALAAGRRPLVARWLAWRAACLWGLSHKSDAERTPALLGTPELDLPGDLALMPPDVERLTVERARAASALRRGRLDVSGPRDTQVAIDGRPPLCFVPCSMTLPPGLHAVTAEPLGSEPIVQWRDV